MRALQNISIRHIFIGLMTANTLALGGVGVSWMKLNQAEANLDRAHVTRYTSYLLADEFRQSSDDLTRFARTYAVTGEARYEAHYLDVIAMREGQKPRAEAAHRIYWDVVLESGVRPRPNAETKSLLALMREAGFTAAEFDKLNMAKAKSDGLVALETRAMNAVKGIFEDGSGKFTVKREPDLQLARDLLHSLEYHRSKAEIMKPVDEFFDLVEQRTRNAVEDAQAASTSAETILSLCLALLFLALVTSGLVLFVRVMAPISALRAIMTTLSAGHFDVTIPHATRRDEIGDMAKAIEVFRNNGTEKRRLEQEQEARAAETEAQKRAAMQEIAQEFERAVGGIVTAVSSAAAQLKNAAQSMTAAAEETSSQSLTVASASEEASINVQTVAAAAEELAISVSEIARQVSDSARISMEAVQNADETANDIRQLSEVVQRIGAIVDLISNIAGQTNLLALNATIEAARAGEAGRGFAVVAQEVKQLAEQTKRATSEIEAQISEVQRSTDRSASSIRSVTDVIKQVHGIATAVAAAVEQQGSATQEIARNVQQASHGTTEVSANITGVTRAAEDSSASASQVLSSASDLAQQAERLRGEVNSFLANVRAA
jgi:methyl-accepting chemotaxis protein